MNHINGILSKKYFILKALGEGAFSHVYLAQDKQSGEERAIKVMDLSMLPSSERGFSYDLFLREAQILQEVEHPGIPRFYEFFIEGDLMVLVMESVHGVNLETYLQESGGHLEERETLDIFIQVCQILEYLHRGVKAGTIIYRDLKPSNILIDKRGKVRLIDFATARIYSPEKKSDTVRLGTPGYAAPEAYGECQTDTRADIFSVGACMFHLLTGEDPEKYMFEFPPVRDVRTELSPFIQDIVTGALNPLESRTHDITRLKDQLQSLRDTMKVLSRVSPRSLFFRLTFHFIQFLKTRLFAQPSFALVFTGILFFVVGGGLIYYAHTVSDPVKTKSEVIYFHNYNTPHARQKEEVIEKIKNIKENIYLYAKLNRYPECYSQWEELVEKVSPYHEVMKEKIEFYPKTLDLFIAGDEKEYSLKVYFKILSEYEKYLNTDYIGEPADTLREMTDSLLQIIPPQTLKVCVQEYIKSPPLINQSRKVFLVYQIARTLEEKEESDTAMEILNFTVSYQKSQYKNIQSNPMNQEIRQLAYNPHIDILFLQGEIYRLEKQNEKANEYYEEYIQKASERAQEEKGSISELFIENFFITEAQNFLAQ